MHIGMGHLHIATADRAYIVTGLCIYALYRYGLYTYGLHSYGKGHLPTHMELWPV